MTAIAPPPPRGVFVTGTDTGVGKTRVSAALLHHFNATGLRSAGFKPVAAGTDFIDGRQVNEDVALLRQYSGIALSDDEVGPCQLQTACAPHIAAAAEGRAIVPTALREAAARLAARADWLVVEGAGGFRIPLDDDSDSADLAVALGLPVILVVGLRLGCLNHALLTAEAIRARGLTLCGWIANTVDAAMPHLQRNLDTLDRWLRPAPCLGVVPWLDRPDPDRVAAHLRKPALHAVVHTFHSSPVR